MATGSCTCFRHELQAMLTGPGHARPASPTSLAVAVCKLAVASRTNV